jgi:cbb3-type cytochrome oxidase subunit 3
MMHLADLIDMISNPREITSSDLVELADRIIHFALKIISIALGIFLGLCLFHAFNRGDVVIADHGNRLVGIENQGIPANAGNNPDNPLTANENSYAIANLGIALDSNAPRNRISHVESFR